jgi:hypothetical protein
MRASIRSAVNRRRYQGKITVALFRLGQWAALFGSDCGVRVEPRTVGMLR